MLKEISIGENSIFQYNNSFIFLMNYILMKNIELKGGLDRKNE